jgi:hypothetical protein
MKSRRARLDDPTPKIAPKISREEYPNEKHERRVRAKLHNDDGVIPPSQPNPTSPYYRKPLQSTTELSNIEAKFCHNYCAHYNLTRAAIEAGYSPGMAYYRARDLLLQPRVNKEIKRIEAERLARITYDGDTAARINWLRAYHPRMSTVFDSFIPCCRHCHGTNFDYQRTHSEFEADYEKYMTSKKTAPFDQKGGSNFDETLPPNPACPNCMGRGLPHKQRIILKDLNYLPPEAHMLIAGVKIKNGEVQEVLFHDVAPALDHLKGLHQRFQELNNPNRQINIDNLSLEQMEQMIEEGRQLGYLTDDE